MDTSPSNDTAASQQTPRAASIPPVGRDAAEATAQDELSALRQLLHQLDERDWQRPTACPDWSVRDLVCHLVGSFEDSARPWVFGRRRLVGRRRYPDLPWLDALNQVQVDDRRDREPADLLADLESLGPRGIRGRRSLPGALRRLPLSEPLDGHRLAYLVDIIYTRDMWMHRLDLAAATGRPFVPGGQTAAVTRQVLRDLDAAWTGPTAVVRLTGALDERWRLGPGPVQATVAADTVALMRLLSGRPAAPSDDVDDAGAVEALTVARLPF